MPRPIDPERTAARARGDKRYVSARACPQGHVGVRFVISSSCCICADIKRAERATETKKPKSSPVKQKVKRKITRATFERPAFVAAMNDYRHTTEARERSSYLDNLIQQVTLSVSKRSTDARQQEE